jgi:hypothetical protein
MKGEGQSPPLQMEPNPPLLFGTRKGQGFGQTGDRQIRWHGAICDRRNDAG